MSNSLGIAITLICFACDSLAFYWWDDTVLQAVTAYFFANLFKPKRESVLVTAGLCIALESFMATGRVGVYLFPIIPCYFLAPWLKQGTTLTKALPYLLFALTLLINWFIVDPLIFGYWPGFSCTIGKVFANVLVLDTAIALA